MIDVVVPSCATLAELDEFVFRYIEALKEESKRLEAVIKKANTIIEETKDARKHGMGKTTYISVMYAVGQVLKVAKGGKR